MQADGLLFTEILHACNTRKLSIKPSSRDQSDAIAEAKRYSTCRPEDEVRSKHFCLYFSCFNRYVQLYIL